MPVVEPGPTALAAVPGPCTWPLDTSCDPAWGDYSQTVRDRATALATFVLDALTGHQFAQCPVTVRPCGTGCQSYNGYQTFPAGTASSGVPGSWMQPYILGGAWFNCVCPSACSCAPACRVDLMAPVAAVTEVKVDGVVLDPSAYTLTGQWLAMTGDPAECWPSCQNLALPDTETGTWSVTYQPGRPLPVAGQIAAGALASEFAKACAGAACGLPAQVASLTRQGVEVEFVDPQTVLTDGRTGIREVDLFIGAVNPYGRRQRARVLSPDLPQLPAVYS